MNTELVRRTVAASFVGLAVTASIVTMLALADLREPWTTYAARSWWGAAGYVWGGLLPTVAALAWWAGRPRGSVAPLMALLGVAWLAPVWVGPMGNPDLVTSVARLAPPLLGPAALHLVVAFPSGVAGNGGARLLVGAGWAIGLSASLGRVLVLDPFLLPDCWENCSPGSNVFIVHEDVEVARWFEVLGHLAPAGFMVVAILVVAVRCARWPVEGRLLWPVGLAAIAVLAAASVLGLVRRGDTRELPTVDRFWYAFLAQSAALGVLAIAVTMTAAALAGRRARARGIIDDLVRAAEHESLRGSLARRIGDDSVEVAYWLPDRGLFVDADGTIVAEPDPSGRMRTTIERGGVRVAVIAHVPTVDPINPLLGPAGLLAVENERLRAGVLNGLADLRASRARVVAAADASRRVLERNLHDGAQQVLLALALELRLAAAEAEAGRRESALLTEALEEAVAVLADLRDLAHGIFPTILVEAGLEPALAGLADRARVPVELTVEDGHAPSPARRAAYMIVSAAIDHAVPPTVLDVVVVRSGDQLRVHVRGFADADYIDLSDRVGALGGHFELRDGVMEAVIPCA